MDTDRMSIFPFQDDRDSAHFLNLLSQLKPSSMFEKERGEPKDVVQLSTEGKKHQILDQAKSEVLERIRTK
jgi:hypothetical protein